MTRLMFALDFPEGETALEFVKLLNGIVDGFKVGSELFAACGSEIVRKIKEKVKESEVLLDLKLHDIPATVERTLKVLKSSGADFVTLHVEPNYDFESKIKLVGVTVLTSLGDEDLKAVGYGSSREDLVKRKAVTAKNLGFSRIVCSGFEAKEIKRIVGKDMLVFVPAVRPSWWSRKDDQKAVVTPKEAAENGADYVIVGRPVRDADDPAKAAKFVKEELQQAFYGGAK